MTSNYRISTHRQNNNCLHVQMEGIFDDIAMAFMINEIDDEIRKRRNETRNVYIHTDNVEKVSLSPMGRGVFEKNMSNYNSNAVNIQFTGRSRTQLRKGAMALR